MTGRPLRRPTRPFFLFGLMLLASDGLAATSETRLTAWGRGTIVLGGHPLDRPYHLAFVEGRLTVNGLSLPDRAPAKPRALDEEGRTIAALVQTVTGLRDSLLRSGADDATIFRNVADRARSNPLVRDVRRSGPRADLRFRNGLIFGLLLRPSPRAAPQAGLKRQDREWRELRDLQSLVDAGCVIFIVSRDVTHVVSSSQARAALDAVAEIRAGRRNMGATAYALPRMVRSQVEKPLKLERRN